MCKHFNSQGGCILGNLCKFAHGLAELRHPNKNQGIKKEGNVLENYKIIKCKYWEKNNTCKFGKLCTFAHGKKDLRTRDNNIMEAMKNNFYNRYGTFINNYHGNLFNDNQNFFYPVLPQFNNNTFINNNLTKNEYENFYNINNIKNTHNYNYENFRNRNNNKIELDKNVKVFNINNGLFKFPIQ